LSRIARIFREENRKREKREDVNKRRGEEVDLRCVFRSKWEPLFIEDGNMSNFEE